MRNTRIFFISLLLLVYAANVRHTHAQDFPANLLQKIPDAPQKLLADDVTQRATILFQLVERVPESCTMEQRLPVDLQKDDYNFIVAKILEKDLSGLSNDKKYDIWGKLIFLIQKFEMKWSLRPLSRYLGDSDWQVQANLISVLKVLDAREFDGELAELLSSSNQYIREETLRTLIDFRSKKAIPALLPLLADSDHLKRYWAVESLVKVNAKEAARHIARLLVDEEPDIRFWAVDALVKLNAKDQAPRIWQLVNSGQTQQTEAFSIAALVYFGDARAFPLAGERITNPKEGGPEILKYLIDLNAKQIIPTLISILSKQPIIPDVHWGRTDIVYALGKLNATEASGELRAFIQKFPQSRAAAIEVLGDLGDKAAVDDLTDVFNSNDGSDSADAAVALAKIGDRKNWKALIDAAEDPKYPYRSQIIQQLNRHLDEELWKKATRNKVKGVDYKSVKENSDLFSIESGIPIILEFDPAKDISKRNPLEGSTYPWMRAGHDEELTAALSDIVGTIDAGTLPNTFTFIFDKGTIRILKVENAVAWWRKNILTVNKLNVGT